MKTVTIIGLGLIGGSLAKALRFKAGISYLYAIDLNDKSIKQAIQDGVLTNGGTSWIDEMNHSDLILICTPVSDTVKWVEWASQKVSASCIISDAGSTKGEIVKFVEQMEGDFCFVGGHPMAGSEKTGYMAAKADLFENAYYLFTPCSKSTPKALAQLTEMAKKIGAIPLTVDERTHDCATGAISHLPHVIASGIVNLVSSIETEDGLLGRLAAGGFRDITRIASSSPTMWKAICQSNAEALSPLLRQFSHAINQFCEQLEDGNASQIENFFEKAKEYRDQLPVKQVGLLPESYEVTLDIPDRIGVIGEVATLLAKVGVNIQNIHVANSREYEGGVLIVSVKDSNEKAVAEETLIKNGYGLNE